MLFLINMPSEQEIKEIKKIGDLQKVAKSLGIEQAFKPNITRYTNMLFEREAFKRSVEYKYEDE